MKTTTLIILLSSILALPTLVSADSNVNSNISTLHSQHHPLQQASESSLKNNGDMQGQMMNMMSEMTQSPEMAAQMEEMMSSSACQEMMMTQQES